MCRVNRYEKLNKMKKAIAILSIVAFAASFTACKKDYTCKCTYDLSGTSTTISYEYTKVKKADAEEACELSETAWKLVDSGASCSI